MTRRRSAAPSAYHCTVVLSGATFHVPWSRDSVLSTFTTPLMAGGLVVAMTPGSTAGVAAEMTAVLAKPVLLAVVLTWMLWPSRPPGMTKVDLVALGMATPLAYHW